MKKNIVILTGAGISQESGIPTFRDADGLWNNYNVDDVASIKGYNKNKEMVLDFYNDMRAKLPTYQPNKAHLLLVELEKYFNVQIITTNIDDLHERAGSTNILHLHGELTKAMDEKWEILPFEIGYKDIKLGDLCVNESQMRPAVVWFGEPVEHIDRAVEIVKNADVFVVIGTSLEVTPASDLFYLCKKDVDKYIINPNYKELFGQDNFYSIKEKATIGMEKLFDLLTKN